MTNYEKDYEKFVKGNISKAQVFLKIVTKQLHFMSHDYYLDFYSYRLSKYKNMYYLFICSYIKKNKELLTIASEFYSQYAITKLNFPGEKIILIDYDSFFSHKDWFILKGHLLLKTCSLKKLNKWLKYKNRYLIKDL